MAGAWLGMARPGEAWQGKAWLGQARRGKARRGLAFMFSKMLEKGVENKKTRSVLCMEEEKEKESDWKEIKGGTVFTFSEPGAELEGKFVDVRTEQGKFKSVVYDIEKGDGELVSVFGSTVLDGRMKSVQKADFVRIRFKGLVKSEKTGREYADFQVFVKEPENEGDT